MSLYKTVVVATDLSAEAYEVAAKAFELAKINNADLHIAHVIEPLSFAYGGDIPMDFSDLQTQIQKQTEAQMSELASHFNVPEQQQHIDLGRPASEIHLLVEALSADLVIVGSHGKHGLALLLGSTANSIIHGSSCDVLAVRVNREE
jgi:universal stress protein A